MDLDSAAAFLVGSIAYGFGVIVWIGLVVVINNLLHKYWKPVRIFTADSWQFYPPHKFEEPILNKEVK